MQIKQSLIFAIESLLQAFDPQRVPCAAAGLPSSVGVVVEGQDAAASAKVRFIVRHSGICRNLGTFMNRRSCENRMPKSTRDDCRELLARSFDVLLLKRRRRRLPDG